MTGFGRGAVEEGGYRYVVEARSVNNRYCEVRIQAPKELLEFEHKLTHQIKEGFARGKFDLVLKTERYSERESIRKGDEAVVRCWKDLERLRKKLGLKEPVSLEIALERTPAHMSNKTMSHRVKMFEKASQEALKKLRDSRLKEGKVLAKDIQGRIQLLKRIVAEIERKAKGAAKFRFKRAKDRLNQLLKENEIDSARLNMEIALLVEKSDVTEEIVRLKSHLNRLKETLKIKESMGRKLDFLLQEVNREINTIGSKTVDLGVTNDVVQVKAEIEKIREQSQNLE